MKRWEDMPMKKYYIVWWNVENLFDVENSPRRTPRLEKTLKGELAGWNKTVLDKKIAQLASILLQVNQGNGPDLLGVCEVENRYVLDLLKDALSPLNRDYEVAHHDGPDGRGTDAAFIYDAELFGAEEEFSHVILKRSGTREIFQVNMKTASGNDLVIIGNHWPSRLGSELQSEPYRMIAAETLSYFLQRIQEEKGNNVPILVMGDFNDEPFNRSVADYALSTHVRGKVMRAKSPRLFNLMWPLLGSGLGTYYFGGFPLILDQFLVSRGALNQASPLKVYSDSPAIIRFPEMVSGGAYPDPIRFGRPAKDLNEDGFSDHFPISVVLQES
jgi:endonuclease/exonuclease/phosphatase family metal-dependent hydrolase